MCSSGIKKKKTSLYILGYLLEVQTMYKNLKFFYKILRIFKPEIWQFFPTIIIEFTMRISQNSNNEFFCKIKKADVKVGKPSTH